MDENDLKWLEGNYTSEAENSGDGVEDIKDGSQSALVENLEAEKEKVLSVILRRAEDSRQGNREHFEEDVHADIDRKYNKSAAAAYAWYDKLPNDVKVGFVNLSPSHQLLYYDCSNDLDVLNESYNKGDYLNVIIESYLRILDDEAVFYAELSPSNFYEKVAGRFEEDMNNMNQKLNDLMHGDYPPLIKIIAGDLYTILNESKKHISFDNTDEENSEVANKTVEESIDPLQENDVKSYFIFADALINEEKNKTQGDLIRLQENMTKDQELEEYGNSGKKGWEIKHNAERAHNKYVNASNTLQKLMQGEKVSREDIKRDGNIILGLIDGQISNAGYNLHHASQTFSGLDPEQMQEEYGSSGDTKQSILDGYQRRYDKCVNAKKFFEQLTYRKNSFVIDIDNDSTSQKMVEIKGSLDELIDNDSIPSQCKYFLKDVDNREMLEALLSNGDLKMYPNAVEIAGLKFSTNYVKYEDLSSVVGVKEDKNLFLNGAYDYFTMDAVEKLKQSYKIPSQEQWEKAASVMGGWTNLLSLLNHPRVGYRDEKGKWVQVESHLTSLIWSSSANNDTGYAVKFKSISGDYGIVKRNKNVACPIIFLQD